MTNIDKVTNEKRWPIGVHWNLETCEWHRCYWSVLNNSQTHTNSPVHSPASDSHECGLAKTALRDDPAKSLPRRPHSVPPPGTPLTKSVVKEPCSHSYLDLTLGVWDPGIPCLTGPEATWVGIFSSPPNQDTNTQPHSPKGWPKVGVDRAWTCRLGCPHTPCDAGCSWWWEKKGTQLQAGGQRPVHPVPVCPSTELQGVPQL